MISKEIYTLDINIIRNNLTFAVTEKKINSLSNVKRIIQTQGFFLMNLRYSLVDSGLNIYFEFSLNSSLTWFYKTKIQNRCL